MAVFDPSSVEWIALLIFLVSSALAAFSFVHSASAYHWKIFYRRSDTYRPPFFIPELYSTMRVCAWLLIGLGVWFGWREGFRSEAIPPVPVSGVIPTTNEFFLLNLFYIIFLGTSVAFSFSFFGLGLNLGWFGIVLLFELGTLAMVVLIIIYGWMIWFLPGLLALIGGVFVAYSVVMVFLHWLYAPPLLEAIIADPFEHQIAQYETMYASMKAPRVETITHGNGTTTAKSFYASPPSGQYSVATPTTKVINHNPPQTKTAAAAHPTHPLTAPQDPSHLQSAKWN